MERNLNLQKNKINEKKRYDWIDIAKGIAVLLMVFGHSNDGLSNVTQVNAFVYSFHMPLFFIVSGYLFKPSKDFVKKKSKSILLPYFFLYLLTVLCSGIIDNFSKGVKIENIISITKSFLYGCGLDVLNGRVKNVGPLWFLPCFFVSSLIFYFFFVISKKIGKKNDTVMLGILCTACASFGILISDVIMPWSIDIAFVCQVFMFAGYVLKNCNFFDNEKSVILTFLVSASFWIISTLNYNNISLNDRHYGNSFLTIITAICGTFVVLFISKLIDRLVVIPSVLSFFGKISLIVLSFHISGYNIFHLYRLDVVSSLYGKPFLLTLFRIIWCVVIYLIISITPLYIIFFNERPKLMFIKVLKQHISNFKNKRKWHF